MKRACVLTFVLLMAGLLFGSASEAWDDSRWHLPEGVLLRLGKGGTRSAVYSADRTRLAVSSTTGIWIYDARSYAELALIPRYQRDTRRMALSPDGSRLICTPWTHSAVEVWDTAASRLQWEIRADGRRVDSVTFSPDGSTVATGNTDGAMRLWNAESGKLETTLHGHEGRVWSLAYSPDGATLAGGGSDGRIRLWDLASSQPRATLQGHTHWISSMSFSPDGTVLASGSYDETIRLWDVASGQQTAILEGHSLAGHPGVSSVAFSPDGSTLASGSGDETVRLWDSAELLSNVVDGRAPCTV